MNIINEMPQQTTIDASEIASVTKNNNFVIEEDRQLCCSFFHVSQDTTTSSITIKINMFVELSDLPNFLKQNGESLNMTLPNLLGTTE
jgi:uncharacterized protein YjiK